MRGGAGASRCVGMRGGNPWSAALRVAFGRAFFIGFVAMVSLSLTGGASQAQQPAEVAARLGPIAILGSGPSYLDLGAGVYDLVGNAHRNQTAAGELEFFYGKKILGFGPATGVIENIRGGGMFFVGFYNDFTLGPVVLTPLLGLGAWWHGGSNDENLGGTFEYRLELNFAYQFDNLSRLGFRLGHISNANAHARNPGDNDLMLTYSLPLPF